MKEDDLDIAFQAALEKAIAERGYGARARLARKVGVTPTYITRLIKSKSYGSEQTRRRIADAFGFTYEDFLNYGRGIDRGEENTLPEMGFDLWLNEPQKPFIRHDESRARQKLYARLCELAKNVSHIYDLITLCRMAFRFSVEEPEASRRMSEEMRDLVAEP